MKILTMILAGGTGKELSALTRHRAKTAVPFGGRYRIIDFCLSNSVHSGINNIAILAQYNPKSLIEHIRMGKPWDLDRKTGGVQILQPNYRGESANWYSGTADALYQNVDVIRASDAEHVLVLSGDQVYIMDYREMIHYHIEKRRPVTIACKNVRTQQRGRFGMVRISREGLITEFREKPSSSTFRNASMGIYLFEKRFLLEILSSGISDIVFDIVIPVIKERRIAGFLFGGYWEDIGSIPSYYRSCLRSIRHGEMLNRPGWPIYTRGAELPPARFIEGSSVMDSIIADGCVIKGTVSGSVLFPGVEVEPGAKVEDSIIFSYSRIGRDCRVCRSIIDKDVVLGKGVRLGTAKGGKMSGLEGFIDTDAKIRTGGITVLGKGVRIEQDSDIPQGLVIEPQSVIKA